ncbi:MAG: thioesterase family protein [Hyphomicrobiaceae bacterium]
MKESLRPGLAHRHVYEMAANKRVPDLYPESPLFLAMPGVFATGFMVGLLEWGALETINPHLDPGEGSLGIDIRIDHTGATLPGQTITVDVTVTAVQGRRISFDVSAHDGIEVIGKGTHQRMVVPWDRFVAKVNQKAARAGVPALDWPPSGGPER